MNNQMEPMRALELLDRCATVSHGDRHYHAQLVLAVQALKGVVMQHESEQTKRATRKAAKEGKPEEVGGEA